MSTTFQSSAAVLGLDRRRSEREPYVAEAWICTPSAMDVTDERLAVTSVNLSRHGVEFELGKPLPEGSCYTMEIGLGEQRLCSDIKVVSIRRIEKGHFSVGAEFC